MNFIEKLMSEWREDAEMADDLMDEARRIPLLHCKWLDKYQKVVLMKKEALYDFQMLYKEKYSFYMGREEECPDVKIMKNEVPIYLNADKQLNQAQGKLDLYDTYEKTLKEILNNINNRSFQIKNAIDWLRYSRGIDE
tara:strand:- start:37 stop:450 length:414 start_codon:yes stop_codon:yes gene_type:complete